MNVGKRRKKLLGSVKDLITEESGIESRSAYGEENSEPMML